MYRTMCVRTQGAPTSAEALSRRLRKQEGPDRRVEVSSERCSRRGPSERCVCVEIPGRPTAAWAHKKKKALIVCYIQSWT